MKFVDLSYENKRASKASLQKFDEIEASGHYLLGECLDQFEEKFAIDQETSHCVGVKNATDALAIAFRIFGAKEKTVIVPQFGAYPTVMAALQANAKKIIAAPVDEKFCLDLTCVDVPKNSIIVPVNLFGNAANLDKIDEVAKSSDCLVIEDCAQSTGLPRKKRKSVVASIHSFYPTKPLGSRGDGGAILTDDYDIASLAKKARFYGLNQGSIDSWGFNSRMDEWQSSFLSEKITYYRSMNDARRRNANVFNQSLDYKNMSSQTQDSVFHQYVTLWKNRDEVQKTLKDLGIPTMVHYPKMISDMPYLRDKVDFLPCKRLSDHILSLPVGPHLDDEEVSRIASALKGLRDENINFQEI